MSKGKRFLRDLKRYKVLLLMLLPAIIYVILFNYIPMGGIVLAFKKYNYIDGIFKSPWNGLENFKFFFNSGQAFTVTKNTLLYNAAFIIINNVLQLTVAILLVEIKNKYFVKAAQSIMFLPYFISWVVVSVISFNFLSYDYGFVNKAITFFGGEKINIYSISQIWPAIIIFFNAWKNVGYGSILYLASIMGIDTSIYEAAEIDGASKVQRIFKITIPMVRPTIIVLVLLAVGGIFKGNFDLFYNLVGSNGILYDATDVIDTYTFRALIYNNDIGMSAASGFFQSALCFITVIIANKLVSLYDKDYTLF